jgi:hypothetical protein
MLDVIELFGDKTTRDELGIGGIRDAFADLLFPGTSTIQTAAKYFLLVPWVYMTLEAKRVASNQAQARGRALEIKIANSLTDSGETKRVIGRLAKEKLQRLPSSVYWQGLLTWGIRRFDGFPDAYYRSLDQFYIRLKGAHATNADFDGESFDAMPVNWDPGLPPIPEDFPNSLRLALSPIEAEYLRERVITNCPNSLLAFLLRERTAIDGEAFVWDLELDLPDRLAEWLHHGRLFSEAMHGAQLIYNLILAEHRKWQEKIELYRAAFDAWCEVVRQRHEQITTWNLERFWQIVSLSNPRIIQPAKTFVERWVELVRATSDPSSLADASHARTLVCDREQQIKRGLARVLGGRALEIWQGESGAAQLDLRWLSSRRILSDILVGLEADNLVGTE